MSRLTDTQRIILSSASRRNDRGVDLPANVTGEALRKAVDKLIRARLLEEVRDLRGSTSWRITAPLRRLKRTLDAFRAISGR